jgi:hypothetical protein
MVVLAMVRGLAVWDHSLIGEVHRRVHSSWAEISLSYYYVAVVSVAGVRRPRLLRLFGQRSPDLGASGTV